MKQKVLALLLTLALILSYATVFSAQVVQDVPTPSAADSEPEESSDASAAFKPVDLKQQTVPASEVPDLIDYDVAVSERYVCRAYWEETSLNEVVFLKADGSLARYVFSFPVKYEVDGEVYDKQPLLQTRETLLNGTYRFELAEQNDTTLYCGENLSHGFFY